MFSQSQPANKNPKQFTNNNNNNNEVHAVRRWLRKHEIILLRHLACGRNFVPFESLRKSLGISMDGADT
jgi:hypothetical protein